MPAIELGRGEWIIITTGQTVPTCREAAWLRQRLRRFVVLGQAMLRLPQDGEKECENLS